MSELRQRALDLLRRSLADPLASFREGQAEAIELLLQNRGRLLVVQRTGWGKSIVYFIATRLLRDAGAGPTLLISPLLALMRNQIEAARRLGVRAATINSSNKEEWEQVKTRLRRNEVDLLLISPERLANDEFRDEVVLPIAGNLGLLVVDEAHCISDWGHDFRPDYRRIVRILQALPPTIPVLATTATANERVVADVAEQLGPTLQVVRGSLARDSLCLQTISLPSQAARLAWLAEYIPQLPGSGIIYALTVRDAERVAEWLQLVGVNAHAYSGDTEGPRREALEQHLLDNKLKVLVATSALGMGFDKADLGFVVHFQRPGSVVHYYQQVGRAGRALDIAYGILLCGVEDSEIADYFIRNAFPPEGHVAEVLEALEANDGLSIVMLEEHLNLSRSQIDKVLKLLSVESPAPVVKQGSRWYAAPVHYAPNAAKAERLIEIRHAEQAQMEQYVQGQECLMAFLRRALDDMAAEPCGRCAVCLNSPLLPESYSISCVSKAATFLRQSEQAISPRNQWPGTALATQGWHGNIDPRLKAEEGRALCRWGDAGWGALVSAGKQITGFFDEALVEQVAQLVEARWQPSPVPTWVTCVPSLLHPHLVPDFARRVAERLNLPFSACVQKRHPTAAQKTMSNSYQQARNLAEAFAIERSQVQTGPVLLVDDIVDSRWTFTIVAALLRKAGSGPVFPLALASATS